MGFQDKFTVYNIFVVPFIIFMCSVIFLAAVNKSVGVRSLYIKILILIFKWGSQKIESQNHKDEDEELEESTHGIHKKTVAERRQSLDELKEEFKLADTIHFIQNGIQTIVKDDVTKSFKAAELSSWNLLTRTNTTHQFISVRLTTLWLIGCFLRYCILFPFRFILACTAITLMFLGTFLIGYLPKGKLKKFCHTHLALTAYRIMSRSFSAVVTFHNRENRATGGGICVANHTSPIDIVILGGDNCYSMVGQIQKGFFGIMQRAFSRAETHVWFQRSDTEDRKKVAQKLRHHATNPDNLPVLIFPEGTCISNETVVQFKKGSFEVGVPVYPIAIKYDPMFSDPFWNSDKFGVLKHLALIMSSWALVADIWYLPPTTIKENEGGIQFANRVKSQIASQGGLVDLNWDGAVKRKPPTAALLQKQQEEYISTKKLHSLTLTHSQ